MKKILIILGILLVLNPLVTAVGFSPTKLAYNLESGTESCQTITVNSTSEKISVSDWWAENEGIEWNVALFKTSSSTHSLTLKYPSEIFINESKVEVCLSGTKPGKYHGLILLKEEQNGNSVVQMAVWLNVTITEKIVPPAAPSSGGGGGGGSSGGGSAVPKKETLNATSIPLSADKNAIENEEKPEVDNEQNNISNSSGITGAVIGANTAPMIIAIILITFIIAVSILVYFRRRRI
jgi:hypothetical protein